MAMASMTTESRALLALLARQPQDEPETGAIGNLSAMGFAEKHENRWQITRSGKTYLKTHR